MPSLADLIQIYINEKPIRKIELVLAFALFTGGATVATWIGVDRSVKYLTALESSTATVADLCSLVLFLTTILLISSHIITAVLEINWVTRDYESVIPAPQNGALLIAGIMSILLVLLAYGSNKILWFSFGYLVFTVFDIAGMAMLSNTVDQHLNRLQEIPNELRPEDLAEVRLFYVDRPWKRLGLLRITLVLIALVVMVQRINIAAYLILIGAILLNEIFVWSWRIRLYKRHRFVFS